MKLDWRRGKKLFRLKSISQWCAQLDEDKLCHLVNNTGRHIPKHHLFPGSENIQIEFYQ